MRHFIFGLLFLLSTTLSAQDNYSVRIKHYNVKNTVAIQGYDPVAYFRQGKAIEGTYKLAFNYVGITYYFSSEENLQLFQANPSQYEPQFGGWCAYAMGVNGTKIEINPKTFKIVNGKLYLFYNAYFNNTLDSWNANEKSLKENAHTNWSKTIIQ